VSPGGEGEEGRAAQPEVGREPAQSPLVLIPVTAEDDARQKRRVRLRAWSAVILVALGAAYFYKRSVDPIHARQSYDAGMRLFAVARYPQAILAFDRAVGLDPNLVDAYLMRGRAYLVDGEIERAISDFSRTVEKRPTDSEALLWRGRSWMELKDYQAVVRDANRALQADSRLAAAYNLRGLAWRALGDPRKALEDLTQAVNLAPDSYNYFQRGATYQMLGQDREALQDFNQMIAIQPDSASAYFARARSRSALGDQRGAAQDRLYGRILDGH
jgi:tetratricopeptide (TPR) repeat protein